MLLLRTGFFWRVRIEGAVVENIGEVTSHLIQNKVLAPGCRWGKSAVLAEMPALRLTGGSVGPDLISTEGASIGPMDSSSDVPRKKRGACPRLCDLM